MQRHTHTHTHTPRSDRVRRDTRFHDAGKHERAHPAGRHEHQENNRLRRRPEEQGPTSPSSCRESCALRSRHTQRNGRRASFLQPERDSPQRRQDVIPTGGLRLASPRVRGVASPRLASHRRRFSSLVSSFPLPRRSTENDFCRFCAFLCDFVRSDGFLFQGSEGKPGVGHWPSVDANSSRCVARIPFWSCARIFVEFREVFRRDRPCSFVASLMSSRKID